MAEINVRISQQNYAISCDDGQEQHILKLARQVDSKVGEVRQATGTADINHALVLSAIIITNDLNETQAHVAALEKHIRAQDEALRQAAADIEALQQREANEVLPDMPQSAVNDDQLQEMGNAVNHLSQRVLALANRVKALA